MPKKTWPGYPKYYTSFAQRITWKRVPEDTLPKKYKSYWEAHYNGQHIADLFKGEGQHWFLLVFGRVNIWHNNVEDLKLHLAGMFVHPKT